MAQCTTLPPGDVCEPAYVLPRPASLLDTVVQAVSPDDAYAGTGFTAEAHQQITFFAAPDGRTVRLRGRALDTDGTALGAPTELELSAITAPDIVPLQSLTDTAFAGELGRGWALAGVTIEGPPRACVALISTTLRVTVIPLPVDGGETERFVQLTSVTVPAAWGTSARAAIVANATAGVQSGAVATPDTQHLLLGSTVDTGGVFTNRLRRATLVPIDDIIEATDVAATTAAAEAAAACAGSCGSCSVQSSCGCSGGFGLGVGGGAAGTGSCTPRLGAAGGTPLSVLFAAQKCAPQLQSIAAAWIPLSESVALAHFEAGTPPTVADLWINTRDTPAPVGAGPRLLRHLLVAPQLGPAGPAARPLLYSLISAAPDAMGVPNVGSVPAVAVYDAATGIAMPVAVRELSIMNFDAATARDLRVAAGMLLVSGNLWTSAGDLYTPAAWFLGEETLQPLTQVAPFGRVDLASSHPDAPANAQLVASAVVTAGNAASLIVVYVDTDEAPEFPEVASFTISNPNRSTPSSPITELHSTALRPAVRSSAAVRLFWPVYTAAGAASLWGDIAFSPPSINPTPGTAITYRETDPVPDDSTRRVLKLPLRMPRCGSVVPSEHNACRAVPLLQAHAPRTLTVSTQDAGAAAIVVINGVLSLGDSANITDPRRGMLRFNDASGELQLFDGATWGTVQVV